MGWRVYVCVGTNDNHNKKGRKGYKVEDKCYRGIIESINYLGMSSLVAVFKSKILVSLQLIMINKRS